MNLYAYAGNNPVTFSDPYGLSPDGGVLEAGLLTAAVGLGVVTAAYAYVHGEELGDAVGAGYEAGRDLVLGVWNAVSTKVLDRQAKGQVVPIVDHLNKLSNPNQPGGKDPKNRDKWKDDARRAIERLKKVVNKMKGKQKQEWEETARRYTDKARDVK